MKLYERLIALPVALVCWAIDYMIGKWVILSLSRAINTSDIVPALVAGIVIYFGGLVIFLVLFCVGGYLLYLVVYG